MKKMILSLILVSGLLLSHLAPASGLCREIHSASEVSFQKIIDSTLSETQSDSEIAAHISDLLKNPELKLSLMRIHILTLIAKSLGSRELLSQVQNLKPQGIESNKVIQALNFYIAMGSHKKLKMQAQKYLDSHPSLSGSDQQIMRVVADLADASTDDIQF